MNLNILEPNNYNQNSIKINDPLIPFYHDKTYTLILNLEETLSYVSKLHKKIKTLFKKIFK